ncbi:MAG: multidrug effflux MFS transporter [Rhodosalinus sp.]
MSDLPQVRLLDKTSPPHIATLILLSGLQAMAMNIFLPSLPSMGAHFGTTAAIMGLSVGAYLATSAVIQVLIGPVADNIGRRPVILGSLVVFCLGTLGCIYAPNLTVFMLCRMVQAVAVVGMVMGRAVVRDMVPMEEAGSRIAYVTMGMAVVPMLAPALGGVLDQSLGWQANFWLLLLAGLALFALAWMDLGETGTQRGITMMQQFREYPELLRSQRFWGYCMAGAFAGGSFFSYLGGAPFVGSEIYALEPARLGIYFGAPAVGYLLGNYLSGRLSTRLGINRLVLTGTILITAAMLTSLILTLAGLDSAESFFGLITVVGLGNGLAIPTATAGMLSVRPHLAGTASGFGGAVMIGGGAALSALAGLLLGPGTGPYPLIGLMGGSAACGVVAMLLVIRRQRRLGL